MNRVEIKAKAREKIKGKLWDLWKPTLIVMCVTVLIGALASGINPDGTNNGASILISVLEFLMCPLTVGLIGYYLNFVRNKSYKVEDIWKYYKKIWPILLISFLTSLFIALWTILLVIPGIIAALSYSMVMYLMADDELDGTNTIRKSKEMMNGYKWDYFVFCLSFIWWILLVCVTFGIAAIYVLPYMTTAQTLYYEELRKNKKIKA